MKALFKTFLGVLAAMVFAGSVSADVNGVVDQSDLFAEQVNVEFPSEDYD